MEKVDKWLESKGFDEMLDRAEAKGREMVEREPRARAVRYDTVTGRVILDLINGCTYIFPVTLVQDFQNADPKSLDEVIVDSAGFNLNWPKLDVDLYVPALVAGVFGTRRWMDSALARKAGTTKSPAKSAAARANGKMGGRPKKVA